MLHRAIVSAFQSDMFKSQDRKPLTALTKPLLCPIGTNGAVGVHGRTHDRSRTLVTAGRREVAAPAARLPLPAAGLALARPSGSSRSVAPRSVCA